MAKTAKLLNDIDISALEIAPSQVWGSVRIVPLLRREQRHDIRLVRRNYDEDFGLVSLDGEAPKDRKTISPGMKYFSYVPHALVMSWTDDGSPLAVNGTKIFHPDGKKFDLFGCVSLRLLHRMAKREERNQLRFLPLHMAMEGFLSMFFSGPDIAWTEYSQYALSHGLGCRIEFSVAGRFIQGLEDALKVFEIHPWQVGVLVFVADALASAFILPNSNDYRALHTTLLEDFFGELLYQYGMLYDTVCPIEVKINDDVVKDFADLRKELFRIRSDWAEFQGFMASGLLQRPLLSKVIYETGPFVLQRFMTDLDRDRENHIGEAIITADGDIQYLKTYRLSSAQTRRAYLLSQLAEHNWNFDATAAKFGCSREDLVERFEKAGFGYLLSKSVRDALKKRR